MRDEKEERKKQARSNKQTRQSNTAHPRQSLFLEKMSCLGWDSNPRHVHVHVGEREISYMPEPIYAPHLVNVLVFSEGLACTCTCRVRSAPVVHLVTMGTWQECPAPQYAGFGRTLCQSPSPASSALGVPRLQNPIRNTFMRE